MPLGQQALDALTQQAQALAEVARGMSRLSSFDDGAVRMLLANVRLADVAARLACEPAPHRDLPTGELELF